MNDTIMRPLDLTPFVKSQLADLAYFAEAHPLSEETMKARAEQWKEGTLSELPEYTLCIPGGWTLFYAIEIQPIVGALRRLQVSVDVADKLPPEQGMIMLMQEIGFINPIDKCICFPEELPNGLQAMNVQEPVDGDMNRIAFLFSRIQ